MLQEKLESIKEEAVQAFAGAKDPKELYDIKVKYLGKQGAFSGLMREFGSLPAEEKPKMGQLINQVKNATIAIATTVGTK